MEPSDSRTAPGQGRLENPLQLTYDAIALTDIEARRSALSPAGRAVPKPRSLHDLVAPDDRAAVERALGRGHSASTVSFRARPRAGGPTLHWQLRRTGADGHQVRVTQAGPASTPGAAPENDPQDPTPPDDDPEPSAPADHLPAGVFRYQRTGDGPRQLRYANPALCELTGVDQPADLESLIARAVAVSDRAPLLEALEQAEHRLEPLRHECAAATGDAGLIELRVRFGRALDGSIRADGLWLERPARGARPHTPAASDQGFRQLYQRTPIMLQSLDRDGHLIAVSDYWLEHLGYRRKEVIGCHSSEFLPSSRRHKRDDVLAALMRHGRCKDVSSQLVCKEGEIIDVLVSADAELDANGRLLRARCVLIDVTEQRRVEASYRDIFENTTEGVYRSTEDGCLLRANPALARIHGFESEDELLTAVGNLAVDWYTDPAAYERFRARLDRDGRVEDFEAEVCRRATGERIWTSENARAVYDSHGRIAYVEGTVRDITAQYKARLLARRRGEILEMIARDAPLTATLYEVVKAIEQHWGQLTAAVFRLHEGRLYATAAPGLSNACIRAVDGVLPAALDLGLESALASGDNTHIDVASSAATTFTRALRAAGYGEVTLVPVRDQRGAALGVLAAFAHRAPADPRALDAFLHEMDQIVSIAMEQHRLAQELVRQAHYDALTELPNRALLTDRLALAIGEARRARRAVAVLLLDLDEFKLVNDTLGHSAGDELLRVVSERLRRCLRPWDTVGRLGGDEFVLILPINNQAEAADVAQAVLDGLQESVWVGDRDVTAHPSIGIGVYPHNGDSPEALLQAADTAMYAAKHAGKNQLRYFTEAMNEAMAERLRVETDLRTALRRDQLLLYYQPRVELCGGHVVGAEALLRWRHPDRGLLFPPDFLTVAERGRLIGEIDRCVIRQVVAHAVAWQAAGRRLVLSANLSTHELHAEGFGAELARILIEAGVDPTGLELEITESMLMHDFERASRQLSQLKERAPGVRIALDDFGSGYSSLNYLRHLPLDALKIDRSFVADLDAPDAAATAGAIAKTIVELGANLGLTVVGEGVENQRQAEQLHRFGCHEAQGFWFDPALTPEALERRLDR